MSIGASGDEWGGDGRRYLAETRGPARLPLPKLVPLTLLYGLIFLLGLLGNIAVCLVIIKNSYMRTPTNYYLFSLAVSDLTFLILGLPNEMALFYQQYPWSFGEALCKLRALISEMTSYTSVLTIVCFSVERERAVCRPFTNRRKASLRQTFLFIALSWGVSLLAAVPFALFSTINYEDFPPGSGVRLNESAFCAMLEQNIPQQLPIFQLSSFFFFVLPMCLIVVIYMKIGLAIRARKKLDPMKKPLNTVTTKSRSQSRKSVIRMLVTVVVAFFVCWAPFHLQRLFYLYGRSSPYYSNINEWLFYLAGILYFVSSTVNPIIYNLMSVRYRQAFKETFLGVRSASHPPSLELTSSFRRSNQT